MSEKPSMKPAERLRRHVAYPVVYMFGATFVFTAALIGLSRFTQSREEANTRIQLEKAVLLAVGAGLDESASPTRIHGLFQEVIRSPGHPGMVSGESHLTNAYAFVINGQVAAYGVPFEGQGFWNVIKGVVGVKPGATAITGLAFYEQNETPGLGAEIVKTYFRNRFKGLALGDGERAVGLRPVGTTLERNEVEAVTGATQTCTRLERLLNHALNALREAMRKTEQPAGRSAAP